MTHSDAIIPKIHTYPVEDIAIGQMLALAQATNVTFAYADGHLIARYGSGYWESWPAVRTVLEEIGLPAIEAYFRRHGPEERLLLSSAA